MLVLLHSYLAAFLEFEWTVQKVILFTNASMHPTLLTMCHIGLQLILTISLTNGQVILEVNLLANKH